MGDWNAINSQVPYQLCGGGNGGGGDCRCDGANVGGSPGEVFRDKTGNTLNFRTLKSDDSSINIAVDGDTVNLTAAAGGGSCIPLIKNEGSQFGARYVGLVNVADGGSSRDRGIYLGGVFAGLKNLYSESDQTTLVVVEDESDPNQHLAIVYLRNTRSPFGRIALFQNGVERLSVPAPLDTHPTLIARGLLNRSTSASSSALLSWRLRSSRTSTGWLGHRCACASERV
jgi:hypothetical protein